ncbi:hypothetical protein B2G71_15280 [Novosphingobium sp. PC22D]|uniref:DUF2842 domain-containing protein n=1 Tax=Novosphingobium sp. PC22D TaxID=1962403 RepID=UPI000BF08F8E|nr:DUF2842 domain-containing protein [Novosphingobium sp. PC22D]PEQ11803.1 hypothetical protein B2G71_15280 [Novosphingobium sp. PC22D]
MRESPTWRIPIGIIGLCIALGAYALAVARWVGPLVTDLHALVQLPIYILLGVVWLLPLRRFLIWMETGRWG